MSYEIKTKHAPSAIGPYVQGIDIGELIVTSGQIPVNPYTGLIPKDIKTQTMQSLENIKAIIEKSGLYVKNIIKTTLFVINLDDFIIINDAYQEFFQKNKSSYPARSCVEVSRLPKNVLIEIEAIAYRK